MTIEDDSLPADVEPTAVSGSSAARSESSAAGSDDGRNIDIVASGPAPWRAYLRALGPGLVTGASDDDPSGIATYAQTGARFGLGMLWVADITFPLMAAVQEICDRTALATGRGLGELMVVRFGRAWRIVIGLLVGALILANTLNIAADLVAIGAGMHLLSRRSHRAMGGGGRNHHHGPARERLVCHDRSSVHGPLRRTTRVCGRAVPHQDSVGTVLFNTVRPAHPIELHLHRVVSRCSWYNYFALPVLLAEHAPGRGDA
jgi:Natural resistance-associated macrophage protein